MALISVAELLYDADFVDPVTVLRMVQTVNEQGVAIHNRVPITILASIQSQGGDSLVTLPDLSRTSALFEILTASPLLTASDATGADMVEWNG